MTGDAMIYNVLVCLGDSLTTGARDRYFRSYPLELASAMSYKTRETWLCATEAVNGQTSSDLARNAYSLLLPYTDVYGALILIGTNDSRHGIPPAIFADNVRQIISVCRILSKKPYVLTIPMVDYNRHFLWYTKESAVLIDEYNSALAQLENIALIDIRPSVESAHLIDGVHFSHEGNVQVAETVAAFLHRDQAQ